MDSRAFPFVRQPLFLRGFRFLNFALAYAGARSREGKAHTAILLRGVTVRSSWRCRGHRESRSQTGGNRTLDWAFAYLVVSRVCVSASSRGGGLLDFRLRPVNLFFSPRFLFPGFTLGYAVAWSREGREPQIIPKNGYCVEALGFLARATRSIVAARFSPESRTLDTGLGLASGRSLLRPSSSREAVF